MNDLKVLVITTPIRPIPTEYPPLGSLTLVNALRKAGNKNVSFYDIDGLRPTFEETLTHIQEIAPDVIGISAVVSTAYGYTKALTKELRRVLPNLIILLGGNLGASAEILLKKAEVDFVAVGEGERTVVQFIEKLKVSRDREELRSVPGLIFEHNNQLINTGYPEQMPKESIYEVDWDDVVASTVDIFFPRATKSLLAESTFAHDPRRLEPHRQNKRIGTLVASKGCVARCTFCHRWDRGIRYVPVPVLMQRLEELVSRFDVGFVTFGDENFGTDKRWLAEFCSEIKKYDVLWRVSGMRVNCVTPEYLTMMKEAGCSAVYFGMETGSAKMLQIMEKKVALEDNYNALQWIHDSGLHTTVQLVLGMPGEDRETIEETAKFAAFSACLSKDTNPLDVSINYAQALPGTPLYEFARFNGLIGQSIDDEEAYLLAISDRDSSDEETSLQLTQSPKLIAETWRPYIIAKMGYEYIKRYGKKSYRKQLLKSQYFSSNVNPLDDEKLETETQINSTDTGYFNFPKEKLERPSNLKKLVKVDVSGYTADTKGQYTPLTITDQKLPSVFSLIANRDFRILMVLYPELVFRFRALLPLFVLIFNVDRNGWRYSWGLLKSYFHSLKLGSRLKSPFSIPAKSLRKIMNHDIVPNGKDPEAMVPLRKGR